MCGRYSITTPAEAMRRLFGFASPLPNFPPRYNVAPTQEVPIVRLDRDTRQRSLDMVRWGLVPFWARDAKMGYSLINARADGIESKPAFREPFKSRRCIVPADAFYEWKKLDAKRKQPYAIMMKDRGMFGFAGLWDRWREKASGESVESCTIITTAPNELCATIHDRMPAILDAASYGTWLGEHNAGTDELLALLRPYPADQMIAYSISARVGNVKNDDAALLEPIAV